MNIAYGKNVKFVSLIFVPVVDIMSHIVYNKIEVKHEEKKCNKFNTISRREK